MKLGREGQTAIVIGGSKGIGLETVPAAREKLMADALGQHNGILRALVGKGVTDAE